MSRSDLTSSNGDAQLSVRIGKAVAIDGVVTVRGFLGIGAIIAAALLGSAAIVVAARSYVRPVPGPPT